MFHLVISRYIKPFADIDLAMADHLAFLDEYYRQGVFLLSGPKLPRDGGIIVAKTASREELIRILEQDPFRKNGLIDYEVTGWNPNRRAASLPEDIFPGSNALANPS